MTLHIERAAPADAEAMLPIQIAAFHDDARLYPGVELGGPPGYDRVETLLLKIDQDDTFKLIYEGNIVGGIVVYVEGEGHYHLDLIFIDPAYHGLGLGTQAMQFLEQHYSAATLWTLDTPAYALRNQHFYEKFGFMKVGEVIEPGGILLYSYEKRQLKED